jgi:hypothetical protein
MNSMRKNFPENFVRHLLLFLLANSISLYASSQSAELFSSDEILEFTLSCDMKALMKDRDVKSDYHQAIVKYDQDGEAFEIPLKIKTRGHFRKMRENCNYPPHTSQFCQSDHS